MGEALPRPRFDSVWTEGSPLLADCLRWGMRISSRPFFSPINKLARRSLVPLALHRLTKATDSAFKKNCVQWKVRHSALSPSEFRLFQSDIDLAAVWDRTPDTRELDALATIIGQHRRFFPVLGEVEVYTRAEWAVRMKIRSNPAVAELIQVLWDFRKMRWLEVDLEKPMHAYHREKKEAALASSWRRLEGSAPNGPARRCKLGAGFERKLTDLFLKLGFPQLEAKPWSFYCDYLQCHFNGTGDGALALRGDLSLLVYSVLPPAQRYESENFVVELARLRARSTHSLILLNEWITVKSRQRSHPATAAGNAHWLSALSRALSAAGPINWRGLVE